MTLAAHQKAADYTFAKTRLGIVDTLVSAGLLLALTLGGGLQGLAELWARAFDPGGHAFGIALILSVAFITGAVDLPFSIRAHVRHRGPRSIRTRASHSSGACACAR